MKRIAALLLALSLVVPISAASKRFADPTIAKAYDLFIPIACDGDRIGTGFPVSKNMVMTAKHVSCDEGQTTSISNDDGDTWIEIPESAQYSHNGLDAQILMVPGADYKHVASFREGLVGEKTAGYGIAFDETATLGFVMRSSAKWLVASNAAIGGMSGSALVAEDGKVVGMVVQARATIVGAGIPSSWVSMCIPAADLEDFVRDFSRRR